MKNAQAREPTCFLGALRSLAENRDVLFERQAADRLTLFLPLHRRPTIAFRHRSSGEREWRHVERRHAAVWLGDAASDIDGVSDDRSGIADAAAGGLMGGVKDADAFITCWALGEDAESTSKPHEGGWLRSADTRQKAVIGAGWGYLVAHRIDALAELLSVAPPERPSRLDEVALEPLVDGVGMPGSLASLAREAPAVAAVPHPSSASSPSMATGAGGEGERHEVGASLQSSTSHDDERNATRYRWNVTLHHAVWDNQGRCSIDRVDEAAVEEAPERFFARYWRQRPLLIVRSKGRNDRLRRATTKAELIRSKGNETIVLTTLESHAFQDPIELRLESFLENLSSYIADADVRGSDVRFHFRSDLGLAELHSPIVGVLNWTASGRHPRRPSSSHDVRREGVAASPFLRPLEFQLALGGNGAGLPFHVHGDVIAETLHGRRRWFVYPPTASPVFNPRRTVAHWLHEVYPGHEDDALQECTINAGEALYVPSNWFHATLSLGEAVGWTTNLAPHSIDAEALDAHAAMRRHAIAIRRSPLNFIHWGELGEAAIRAGEVTHALDAFNRCVELNPLYGACHVWLARVRTALADAPAARAAAMSEQEQEDDLLLRHFEWL